MKATKSTILHHSNSPSDSLKKQQNYKITRQEPPSATAVSSLPQILVAMNLAFAISGNSNAINSKHRSAWWANDEEEIDIATDASVKYCKTNHDSVGLEDLTVPTIITTPSPSRAKSLGALTADSFDSSSEETDVTGNTTKKKKSGSERVKEKIHGLRADLQNLTPIGVAGNVLFWWVQPVKWVADPVIGVAEAIVPTVTSKVPFSDKLVGLGLDATASVAHFAYGVTEHMGLMASSPDYEEKRARIMTQLLSLADMSVAVKEKFTQALFTEAGKQEFLLEMDKDLFFSLTLQQNVDIETWTKGFGGLYDYMKKAKINENIEKMGGVLRYFENKAVLGVLQNADLSMLAKERYDDMLLTDNPKDTHADIMATFPLDDVKRYVKFAVAAYGDNGILSANLDIHHAVDLRKGNMTKIRISEHTGIPREDIEAIGIDYGEEPNHLSHFVAMDHSKKKIVLAVRGTHEEKFLDFDGSTKEFLGGRAHKGIATMTENLWKQVSYTIIRLLHENPWYELIVTGHSLGGGVTVLLNMLLHNDERIRGHYFRCIAYGAPPVFTPTIAVPKHITKTCVTIVNQFDKVPFTSSNSVRHQAALIDVVERMDLDLMQRARLILGLDTPNADLVKQMHSMQEDAWKVLPDTNAPRNLGCPAAAVIWITANEKDDNDDLYKYVLADPQKMARAGMLVHKNEFSDHLPARYQHVLCHLTKK